MARISFNTKGNFNKVDTFLKRMSRGEIFNLLEGYAQEGVAVLASATPVDSGLTAASWGYKVNRSLGKTTIVWTNSNVVSGVPVAILLQYGHGTGTGGYVYGRDYINPAIRPIFDRIADKAWKAVTSA